MVGRTLAHYHIEAKIGEGGMGVVYRATDTRLDRTVAVKVLRSDVFADAERKKRFVYEAKTASALNHPNIVTIHDINVSDGVDFMVMEFIKGRPLDHVIGRKGLPLGEALKYAVQIADALAKAHGAGLVHRDLKPANVMITEDGLVKVLDFGLAKLAEPTPGEEAATLTMTVEQAPRTEEGVIVGTVSYMSPEQAEGKKLDARSDIFSFGSMLYEMVTGRRAFQGETRMSTLSAVLREEPPPLGDMEGLPRELERIVAWCLRKDPARRMQHMDDVKIALEHLKEESDSGRLFVPAAPRARSIPSLRLLIAGVALVAALVALTWWLTRGRAPASVPVITRLTSDPGLTASPALSRDGKLLTYASDRGGDGNLDIWVQQVGGGTPIRLTRHEADDSDPVFSPDGTKIAFRSERDGGGIYLVAALGGTEQRIADQGRSPRFSPDGKWIAYWVGDLSLFGRRRMYVMAPGGGQPREVRSEFHSASFPIWSGDSRHLLFLGIRDPKLPDPELFDWWVAPVDGGAPSQTGAREMFEKLKITPLQQGAGDWLGDYVYFAAGSQDTASLWRVAISSRNWRVDDSPRRLTSGTATDLQPAAVPGPDGRVLVVFASQTTNFDLWSLTADVNQGKVSGEPQRLTSNTAADTSPSPSADGKKVVFISNRAGDEDVWIKDLASGVETPLTATRFPETYPLLSPDGSSVLYARFEGPKVPVYIVPALGGVARRVYEESHGPIQHWSPDGKKILYRKGVASRTDLYLRDLESGQETLFLRHPAHTLTASRFSADGRWVVFQTVIAPLRRQIFITPVREGLGVEEKDWIPVTDGSGLDRNAAWSPDGNVLYYVSERDGFRCFWAQRLDSSSKRPAGAAFPIYHFHQARRSLLAFREIGSIGMTVARDRIFFSMPDTAGNVWMAEVE